MMMSLLVLLVSARGHLGSVRETCRKDISVLCPQGRGVATLECLTKKAAAISQHCFDALQRHPIGICAADVRKHCSLTQFDHEPRALIRLGACYASLDTKGIDSACLLKIRRLGVPKLTIRAHHDRADSDTPDSDTEDAATSGYGIDVPWKGPPSSTGRPRHSDSIDGDDADSDSNGLLYG